MDITDGGRGRGRPQVIKGLSGALKAEDRHMLAGWLLRVSRWFGPEPRWRRLQEFAADFFPGGQATPANTVKMSRWENGHLRVPYLQVARYEELLGRPPLQLVSAIATVSRYMSAPGTSQPTLFVLPEMPEKERRERTYDLIDHCRSSDTLVSGNDWCELASLLTVQPSLSVRTTHWNALAHRLLTEVLIANGLSWQLRFDALSTLLSHPHGQHSAIAACAAAGNDPTNQVFLDAIGPLDASNDPAAAHHILRLLRNPPNDRALEGALLASIRKAQHGQFLLPQLTKLTDYLTALTTDAGVSPATVRLAVLVQDTMRHARRPLQAGRTEETTMVVDRILRQVHTVTQQIAPDLTDNMLPDLLHAVLFHPVLSTRVYLAMLLRASPYRTALADSLAHEIARRKAAVDDSPLTMAMVGALRDLGDSLQHTLQITDLVLRHDVAAPLRPIAALSAGHMPSVPEIFWPTAITHYTRQWKERHDPTSAGVLTSLAYGLGVIGHRDQLQALRADDAPDPARRAAAWWLNIPDAIWTSVNR